MSEAKYVPAIGEQFNSVWTRGENKEGITFKGKDDKEYDMKFFTDKSHFEHDIALQSCYYGINGVGRKATDKTYRELIGFPKHKTLVGDSGGFQIASFKIRKEVCNLTPIDSLRWQEANCDVMMNLDVPPTLGKTVIKSDFINALNISVKNFQLFEKERQRNDNILLNVLHGESINYQDIWYNKVKDFNFDGWAVGMKPPFDPMIQAMGFLYLWEKGEFDKNSCKWVHFFGTSGKHVTPAIVYMASKLKDRIKVSYDSSSYNIGSIFRTFYSKWDIGPHFAFGDKFIHHNRSLKRPPCHCPVCNSIPDIDYLNRPDIFGGTLISLHNMMQYIEYNDYLNWIVNTRNDYVHDLKNHKLNNKLLYDESKNKEACLSSNPDKFTEYIRTVNRNEKTIKSLEMVDFVIEDGNTLKNAVKKFERWLIPQEIVTTKQKGIFDF